jgi:intracellular septation protein
MNKKALINLFIEFGAIVTFLVSAQFFDFITSTKIFVAVTLFTLILSYIVRKKVAFFPLFVSVVIIVTGLLTVFFTDPDFIIVETTIYNAICAVFAIVSLYKNKPVLKLLFKDSFDISEEGWCLLTKRWAYMFVFLAVSNEMVRIFLSVEVWVMYKVWVTIITAVFGFYQLKLTRKYRNKSATSWGIKI